MIHRAPKTCTVEFSSSSIKKYFIIDRFVLNVFNVERLVITLQCLIGILQIFIMLFRSTLYILIYFDILFDIFWYTLIYFNILWYTFNESLSYILVLDIPSRTYSWYNLLAKSTNKMIIRKCLKVGCFFFEKKT